MFVLLGFVYREVLSLMAISWLLKVYRICTAFFIMMLNDFLIALLADIWWLKVEIVMQVSDKMDPNELVNLIEILNPINKPGRITIIARMGAENMRIKLPHLIRAVERAGQIVTWVCDPMHGNTIKAPCGLKTRAFDAILV